MRALAVVAAWLLLCGRAAGADTIDTSVHQITDSSYKVRLAATLALSKSRDRRAVIALAGALRNDDESTIRRVAALALGKLGAQGEPAALIKAAADPSSFVREAVASSIGGLPGGLDALLQLSRDEVPQVRASAARSLAQVKDERAQKRRGELTGDPDPAVRRAAGGT